MRVALLKIRIFISNLFRGKENKIDHLFFYSEEQVKRIRMWSNHINTVKGREYSEMRDFKKYGFEKTFKDSKLVAIGTLDDAIHNLNTKS